jgi:hypothetical protein
MRKYTIIPKKRDKQAKAGYLFLDKFLRQQQNNIEVMADKLFEDLLLYGQASIKNGERVNPEDIYKTR